MLYKIIECKATKEEVNKYFNKKRTSLFESFNKADTKSTDCSASIED